MPIYEYECQKCGKVFSHLHRRLNEAAPVCPECGGEAKKKFSSFSAKVATPGCAHAESCPASAGHTCCPGCCHHHH